MNLSIITVPNQVLKTPAKKVKGVDLELKELIDDMRQTMHGAKGVGLAAPQVGVSLKLAVIEYDPDSFEAEEGEEKGEPIPFFVMINPVITQQDAKTETVQEGCLSIPEVNVPVSRSVGVTVLAIDADGNRFRIRAKGFLARILQHEIDHLNGILITDRTLSKKIETDPKGKHPIRKI